MSVVARTVISFEEWRVAARDLLSRGVAPEQVAWSTPEHVQHDLFAMDDLPPVTQDKLTISRVFLERAEAVARHSDAGKWALLYKVAWRITHGERELFQVEIDDDMRRMWALEKEVRHDAYKMQAFVRFRKVEDGLGEQYVAWYRPLHQTLDMNRQFFVDRFGGMRWAILTPYKSLYWDLEKLQEGPGVPESAAPGEDQLEDLWRAYYSSIYNPARVNLTAMQAQMPQYRWRDLPESRVIADLVRESGGRLEGMARRQARSAAAVVPQTKSLDVLRQEVRRCGACDGCARATGPVFGTGPANAKVMLVGEQPGDEEDRQGAPFVGPAGQVLGRVLSGLGLDRDQFYVTNAVKAFHFEERGKRRIHKTPRASEIAVCRPWLDAELEIVEPRVVVCMGATAGQAVLGRVVKVTAERGTELMHRGRKTLITYHPSAVLRAQTREGAAEIERAIAMDIEVATRA